MSNDIWISDDKDAISIHGFNGNRVFLNQTGDPKTYWIEAGSGCGMEISKTELEILSEFITELLEKR